MSDLADSPDDPIKLSDELGVVLDPLAKALHSPAAFAALLRHLGLEFPFRVDGLPEVAEALRGTIADLAALSAGGIESAGDVVALVDQVWDVVDALRALEVTGVPEGYVGDVTVDLVTALGRLPQLLAILYLDRQVPAVALVLRAIGAIDRDDVASADRFFPDNFADFIEDPQQHLTTLYDFVEGKDWDSLRLLVALDRALVMLGAQPRWAVLPEPWVGDFVHPDHTRLDSARYLELPILTFQAVGAEQQAGVIMGPLPGDDGVDAAFDGLFVGPFSTLSPGALESWAGFALEAPLQADYLSAGLAFRPDGIRPQVHNPLTDDMTFGITRNGTLKIGGDSPFLEIDSPFARLVLPVGMDDVRFEVGTAPFGIRVTIDLGDADSFSSDAIGDTLTVGLELGASYDAAGGLDLDLGAQLELFWVPPKVPGPIGINGLYLRAGLAIGDDRTVVFDAELAVIATVTLGIVAFTIDEIGVEGRVRFAPPEDGSRGNLGDAHLTWDFHPPRGIGIVVGSEESPVRGGGFLAFEPELGRYSGAFQIKAGMLDLAVLGLLTAPNRNTPDVAWSLLLVVTTRLTTGLPLGPSFFLTGVGGLVAVERRLDLDALTAAFPTGGLEAILFPEHPVIQAPQLLRDLDTFFPQSRGSVAAGLFLEISWGPPGVFAVQLGVLISLPSPVEVALLGRALINLPSPLAPVIRIQLDVLGTIRPDIPEFSLQAVLVDSYIGPLRIEGGAAFLGRFGDEKDWAVTLGGFHPSFQPMRGLTPPPRLGFDLDLGLIHIAARSYIAITSNTLQFGYEASVSAEVIGLVIKGAFGLDVLIRRKPFGFVAEVWALIAITTKKGREICGVGISAELSGPGHWQFSAVVEARLLGLKASKRIQGEFGEPTPIEGPALADPAADIRDALLELSAFSVVRAEGDVVWADDAGLVLASGDVLEVRQTVAPLDVELEHLNEIELAGGSARVSLSTDLAHEPLSGVFAPGTWQRLSDQDRLRRPAFEPGTEGLALVSEQRAETDERTAPTPTVARTFLDGPGGNPAARPRLPRRKVA